MINIPNSNTFVVYHNLPRAVEAKPLEVKKLVLKRILEMRKLFDQKIPDKVTYSEHQNSVIVKILSQKKISIYQCQIDEIALNSTIVKINATSVSSIELFEVAWKRDTGHIKTDLYFRKKKIEDMSAQLIDEFQSTLSAGQTINITPRFLEIQSKFFSREVHRPYYRFLKHIKFYSNNLGNNQKVLEGAIKDPKTPFLHITEALDNILESGALRVSRGGCLGQSVYSTISASEEGSVRFKKHGISLFQRHTSSSYKKILAINLNDLGNTDTNWIDRFGFGNEMLEVANELASSKTFEVKQGAYKTFTRLQPVISTVDIVTYVLEKDENTDREIERCFSVMHKVFVKARKNSPHFLNNIFFEILKDFVLMASSKEKFDEWDMQKHYEFVFTLCPHMREKFSVDNFNPSFESVLEVLKELQLITDKSSELFFKKFFVLALYDYLIVKVCKSRKLDSTKATKIADFEDLSKVYPNLAGFLFSHTMILELGESSQNNHRLVLNEYKNNVMKKVEEKLKKSDVKIRVKSGLFWTDEVGIASYATVERISEVFLDKEAGAPKLKEIKQLDLKISPNSVERNGFTNRKKSN